jgi:hypothetical protein
VIYFIFFLLQVNFSGAESVKASSPSFEQENESSDGQGCVKYEQDFRQFLIGRINESLEKFRRSANCMNATTADCSKERSESLLLIKKQRKNFALLYERAAYDHIQQRPAPDFARQCLLNRNGIPEFTNNIRDIKIQTTDPTLCIGEKESFQQNLDSRVEAYLSGAVSSPIPTETLLEVKAFQQSPLAKELSEYAKYEKQISDQELLNELSKALFQLSSRVEKLRDKIMSLSDTDLYKLYDFNNQYEVFKSGHPDKERIDQCKNRSHFLKNCTLNLEFSRCGSKIWGFAKDLMPIMPIVDGLQGMSETRAAQDAGVLTTAEATNARVNNTIKALLGFSGATSLVRGASLKLTQLAAPKILRLNTKILSPQEKMALLMKNAQLDDVGRIDEISRVTGRSYSPYEVSEILRAHNIGDGFFEYSSADYRKKIDILKNIGFSADEIDELMRRGLIGGHRNSEFMKIVSHFSSLGLQVESNHIQKSFTEKAAKKAIENIKNGQVRRMTGSICYVVETQGEMRVVLTADKSTVLFAGSHESYNKFYTGTYFSQKCR